MLVVFVHGWGVRDPHYGALPEWLAAAGAARAVEVWLSDYISYSDAVTLDDLVRAFERARLANFPDVRFACVTHSTGGPVLRAWMDAYHPQGPCPLTHLVMLAPPNHGSALAQLGKSRLARMALWFQGAEPGERILDWLELGSAEAWDLNRRFLDRSWLERGIYLFVLAGGAVDPKLYDHLNSYTAERGSDGVVRVAAANLNFTRIRLQQDGAGRLQLVEQRRPEPTAFGIVGRHSHTGRRKGILSSVTARSAATHPVAHWVRRCLGVGSREEYGKVTRELAELPCPRTAKCSMVTFRVLDSAGAPLPDFDLLLTSGPDYSADRLPKGFFLDRQRNMRSPHVVTYYLEHAAMARAEHLGLRLVPRPDAGPIRFHPAEFRGDLATVANILRPHETVLIEIVCRRRLEDRVFRVARL